MGFQTLEMGQSKPAAWGQNAISANKMASGAFSRTRKLGCPFQARLFALVAMRLTYRPPSGFVANATKPKMASFH